MQNSGNSFNTKRIALSGILLALSAITIFAATIIPTNRISLYALSSFFISIIIIEYGARYGWIFYIASSLLSFLAVRGNLMALLPFVFFFGIYGLVKYYIEMLNNLGFEYILKLLYFNVSLTAVFLLFKEFLLDSIKVPLPWWLVIIAVEIVFIIYDYVYTLFIRYYRSNLKRILKI